METIEIATAFVDLVMRYDWNKVTELPDKDVQTLFVTVSAAGFEPTKVVPGKLRGKYLDQDGSWIGDTFAINSVCPYKVIDREGADDYRATQWLDCALRMIQRTDGSQACAETLRKEIERSVPLKPIELTGDGDLLREYPPSRDDSFVDHTRDNDKLSTCVGVHDYCNGWMDRVGATKTHDAIICRSCHLRVLFPRGIKTYGELRKALA